MDVEAWWKKGRDERDARKRVTTATTKQQQSLLVHCSSFSSIRFVNPKSWPLRQPSNLQPSLARPPCHFLVSSSCCRVVRSVTLPSRGCSFSFCSLCVVPMMEWLSNRLWSQYQCPLPAWVGIHYFHSSPQRKQFTFRLAVKVVEGLAR